MLAALPKAPSHYSPFQNEDQALERRNTVLKLMQKEGKISQQDYEKAAASALGAVKTVNMNEAKGRYRAYVDAVIEEAVTLYGFTEEQLLTGGLRITTELDPAVQKAVTDVYNMTVCFQQVSQISLFKAELLLSIRKQAELER